MLCYIVVVIGLCLLLAGKQATKSEEEERCQMI
jgi:hypothetical protein